MKIMNELKKFLRKKIDLFSKGKWESFSFEAGKFTSKQILHELSNAIYDFMCLQRVLTKKQKAVFVEFIRAGKEDLKESKKNWKIWRILREFF